MRTFLVFASLLLGAPLATASAQDGFLQHGLSNRWCDVKTVRQTVIYVDDMMMYDGETDWVLKLDAKLKASLTPGEPVTVVRLSPASGQSHEEWSACWPGIVAGAKETGGVMSWFRSDPAAQVLEQQKYFFAQMGGKLTGLYMAAKRPVPTIDPANPPQKQLLRALASDDGRFTNSQTTIRAIVYSDMAENSDLGSAYRGPPKPPVNYGAKLGSYLRHGVFYGFGLGAGIPDVPHFAENARAFWQAALRTMTATVEGIGSDLSVPNVLPVAAVVEPVEMQFDGQALLGRMTLLVGPDGTLVDSAISIQRLGTAALTGSYICNQAAATSCSLSAQTTTGIATSAPSEDLSMNGRNGELSGKLGVHGQNLDFPLKTQTHG